MPRDTETVLSPWLVADEVRVSHMLSHVVWWKKKKKKKKKKKIILCLEVKELRSSYLHYFLCNGLFAHGSIEYE